MRQRTTTLLLTALLAAVIFARPASVQAAFPPGAPLSASSTYTITPAVYTMTLPSGGTGVLTAEVTFGQLFVTIAVLALGAVLVFYIMFRISGMLARRW